MSTLNVNNINEAGGVDAVITAGVLDSGSLPAGSILQVVSATKTDTFSTTSTSMVDVTGLSVSITPSKTTSKILVIANIQLSHSTTDFALCNIVRDSTALATGAGGTHNVSGGAYVGDSDMPNAILGVTMQSLDSPSTTSAIIYKLQLETGATGTAWVNRRGNNTYAVTGSTITVMEVAG